MANNCPLCNAPNPSGAKFCGLCGTSLPHQMPAPEDDEPHYSLPARVGLWFVEWFLECFPGLFSPGTMVMGLLACIVGLGLVGFGSSFFLLAPMAGLMIGGLGVICYWSACTWLVCGYVCLPSEGLADLRGRQWTAFALLAFTPFVAGLAVIAYAKGPG